MTVFASPLAPSLATLLARTVRSALATGLLAAAACTVQTEDRPAADSAAGTQAAAPAAAPSGAGSATGAAPGEVAAGGTAAGGTTAGTAPAGTDSAVDPTKVKPEDRPRADMQLEVDLAARQLHVVRGNARTASFPVGVGTEKWPTQPGEWVVSQVVWNPEWNPPRDESWTEDREAKAPGEPDNPLGRAQLIYDPPRTVHGTNQPQTVGKASSHGSIRMRNEDITRLAREVMEVAGEQRDEAFYRQVAQNRTEKVIVDLPRVVPIRVR